MTDTRTLTYFVGATIDGFVAGPERDDPTGPGGFLVPTEDYVGFLVKEYPETLPVMARDALGVSGPGTRFDTVLEGRRSYEIGLAAGVPNAYPHLRHFVFSTTLDSAPDPAVELVRDDPVQCVRELKKEPGKGIWIVGGGSLANALRSEIDELIVKLNPVTIGNGVPLWGADATFTPETWTRTDVTVLSGGTTVIYYNREADTRPAGSGRR